jgi:hypothetical protein
MGELSWHCYVCYGEIEDGEGSVFVRFSDVHRVEEEAKKWRKTHRARGGGIAEFAGQLDLARWTAAHYRCSQNTPDTGDSESYSHDVSRLREYREMLGFVCHMADKSWIGYTDLLAFARSLPGTAVW